MKCPACQSENPVDSQFCNKCGSAIELSTAPTLSYAPAQETELSRSLKFNEGEKFGDRYTIIEEIGQGGMGRVYKAKDHELGITVVLKMIRPELTERPGMIDRFRKETLLGRSVSHENVVRVHDLGEVNNVRYISMDFIKGENLAEFIRTSGSLTLSTCLQIALQVCQALKAAHEKGIVHQDLKPQNIMIDNSGKVYVTDFGLARSVSGPPTHRPGKISGTPKYFSPEQARGEESDQRSDIYSLGVILYEMVTGTAPFKADTPEAFVKKHTSEKPPLPSKYNANLPPACEKIILKCLEKKKENRYQSVDELIKDLDAQKTHLPAGAMRRWQKTLMIAALVLAGGVGIYEVARRILPHQPPPSPGRIAVMYAVNNTGDKTLDEKLRWVIPYYLGADLAQSRYLSVLPQDRLMQLLRDMKQLDEARPLSNTLDRVSEAANVGYFVLPSFTKMGDNFWISFTVRKARSDETVGEPYTVKGRRPEDVLSMIDELSAKIKSKLSLSPAEIAGDKGENLAKITTGSFEAVRYYVEAQEDYAQSNFKASLKGLENAVREDPDYGLAYLKMADDYEYLGRIVEQRKYLQKALSIVDRVSEKDRYHIQGYAAWMLNESPLPAIEIYHKMVDRFPWDEEGHMMLAAIYRNLEEWDQTLDQLEKVLAISPRSAYMVLLNKIFIFTFMGRYTEALELTKAGIRDYPRDRFLLKHLPLLYLIQGQYDHAYAELGKVLALQPDDPELVELKGASCLLSGDFASAQDVYERLQRVGEATTETPDLTGRCGLIILHLGRGEFRQAQAEIPEGIVLAQQSGRVQDELDLRLTLAYCQLRLKQYPQVAETVRPILDLAQKLNLKGSRARALHLSGLASLGMGRVEEVKDICQRLRLFVERTGFSKGLRRYEHLMGHIALAESSPDVAIRHFEQAIAWLPKQGRIIDEQALYYDGLAAAYYQSGDWAKAIDTYQSIQGLTTGRTQWGDIYALSYYWVGECYQRSGRSTEAMANYRKFLALWKNADEGLPEVADARKHLEALRKGL